MTKMEFIKMVESLLQGVQTNELSQEDFVKRLKEIYEKEKEDKERK